MADNKAVVRRMFDEVINKGDVDLVDELFDEDFRSDTPQGSFDRAGFKEYVLAWRTGFPDVQCDVGQIIAEGDQVAWEINAKGTHTGDFMGIPPTGKTIEFPSLNIATFKDGKGYRHSMVMDTMGVMIQLGVAPPPPG